jgi:hypothetical protein
MYLQNIKLNNEWSSRYSHFLGSSTEGITLYNPQMPQNARKYTNTNFISPFFTAPRTAH